MKENRLYPSLKHPCYIELVNRRELLKKEINKLEKQGKKNLILVDVGGGKKPYEPLFSSIVKKHISLDLENREADVVGNAEDMPFKNNSIDLVLCTQVLEHVENPKKVIDEIHRILRKGGLAFISVPSIFPNHGGPYDNWRFMKGGLKELLKHFNNVKIIADVDTVNGFFSTLNMYFLVFSGRWWGKPFHWIFEHTVFPVNNILGTKFSKLLKSGDTFAANWLAIAKK